MRRKDRNVDSVEEKERILAEALHMTLAMQDDTSAGAPYQVPLNHVYLDGNIYFHCAAAGKKLDCIRANPNVSVSAISMGRLVVPENAKACDIGMAFESVHATGVATVLEQGDEHRRALEALVRRYGGDPSTMSPAAMKVTTLVRIAIGVMTAKRANM